MVDLANTAMPIKEAGNSKSPKITKTAELPSEGAPKPSSAAAKQQRPVDMKDALLKGVAPVGDGEELMLEVTCGQNQACLYMSRLQLGSKGTCVLFENSWLTPNEFQYISGRETAKDWKRSIKHHGKSLKVLIAKGILTTSPLQCSCGQCSSQQVKDVSKYNSASGDATVANTPMRDSYVTDSSKLKPENDFSPLIKTVAKNLPDARYFRHPGEPSEVMHNALIESPTKACAQADPLLNSRSQDSARYVSSCNRLAAEKGPFGAFLEFNSRADRQVADRLDGCLPVNASSHQQNLTGNAQGSHLGKYPNAEGHESQKTTDAVETTKVKAKKKLEGNEIEQHSHLKEQKCGQLPGENRRTGAEVPKGDVMESSTQPNSTTPKKLCPSADKPIPGKTPGDSGHWNNSSHLNSQPEQLYHSQTNSCKAATQEKNSKKSTTLQTNCQSNASALGGKHLNPCMSGSGNPGDSARLVSEASFLFPSFGTPYYPMITAPQLPTYYPNPYMWPFPAASPSSCSYGWTPTNEMVAPNCLRSPSKESHDCNQTTRNGSGTDPVFNFPWMKRTNISAAGESQVPRDASDVIPSGKRKLDDPSTDYFLPSKHPYLLGAESPRHLFGESVTWPAYNPAAALDFRFLPYGLSSYIPDGRGVFANNFLKGNENPASGLGLYPNFFSSQCLGVNSR